MDSLRALAITKLSKDEFKSISSMNININMDELLFSRLDPQIQFEIRGYYCTANNYRILSYTIIEETFTIIVLYNNEDSDYRESLSIYYPQSKKTREYCGSINAVLTIYTQEDKGKCEEFKYGRIYRKINLKANRFGKWMIDGRFVQNFPDGLHEICGNFIDGKMQGVWQKSYPGKCSSDIMLDYHFKNGQYDGSQRIISHDGNDLLHCIFSNGRLECFERKVDNPDYDRYVVIMAPDGVPKSIKFYSGKVNVYPDHVHIDATLPTIYDPESFPFPNVLE